LLSYICLQKSTNQNELSEKTEDKSCKWNVSKIFIIHFFPKGISFISSLKGNQIDGTRGKSMVLINQNFQFTINLSEKVGKSLFKSGTNLPKWAVDLLDSFKS